MTPGRAQGFQAFSRLKLGLALIISLFVCPVLWASQEAIVTADQAVIYADEQMKSPLGYVKRGKKIKVGEVARNRAQVYPIIVSGKIGYIRVLDVSTERDALDS